MSLPVKVQEALQETPVLANTAGVVALDIECEGAKFHSPTPLVVYETILRDGTTAMLCGTCRDNVGVFWHLLDTRNGEMDWPLRREFGNLTRALAMKREEVDV